MMDDGERQVKGDWQVQCIARSRAAVSVGYCEAPVNE